jgi:hypothetical protein
MGDTRDIRRQEDFRYEIERNPEPDDPATLYYVRVYGIETGDLLEAFTTDDPGREIEAAREVQEIQDERHPDGTPVYAIERHDAEWEQG